MFASLLIAMYMWPPSIELTEVVGAEAVVEVSAATAVEDMLTSMHNVNKRLVNFFHANASFLLYSIFFPKQQFNVREKTFIHHFIKFITYLNEI